MDLTRAGYTGGIPLVIFLLWWYSFSGIPLMVFLWCILPLLEGKSFCDSETEYLGLQLEDKSPLVVLLW